MRPDKQSKRSMDAYDQLPRIIRDELKDLPVQPDTVDLLTVCLRHGHIAALGIIQQLKQEFPA